MAMPSDTTPCPTMPTYCTPADCLLCPARSGGLFGSLGAAALKRMPARGPVTFRLGRNHTVFQESGRAEHVYAIRQGRIKLVRRSPRGTERIVRILAPGDVAGLEALVADAYHLSAYTLGAAEVCQIPAPLVHQLQKENPKIARALELRWQANVDRADQVITLMSTGPAHERFFHFLLQMAEPANSGVCPAIPRDDIAALLGLTIETVSRTIAAIKREGLVDEQNRRFLFNRGRVLEQVGASPASPDPA